VTTGDKITRAGVGSIDVRSSPVPTPRSCREFALGTYSPLILSQ
jgi:hypothetical protein